MRALQLHEWGGELRRVELDRRELGPLEIRLRVEACGVGLTVLNDIGGQLAGEGHGSLPRVPGHEICGEVLEIGSAVTTATVGDRGVVYFYLTCGRCRFCVAGREPLCERFAGFVGVDIDGGYAEEVVVPARNFVAIPHQVGAVDATTIPDAIATSVHICASRARLQVGELVAIIGAGGGVGVHLVQVARLFGGSVVGIDVSPDKADLAREAGASLAFVGEPPLDLEQRVGRRADVVVDTVGTDETAAVALRMIGRGGRLVVLATAPDGAVSASTTTLVLDEISIVGTRYASYEDVRLAVQLVADGSVRPIVGSRVALSDVEVLHEQLRSRTLLGRGAVVP